MKKNKSTFATLMQLEVDQYIQVKPTGFKADYISWCTAWSLVKEQFPDATMEIGEDPTTGLPYFRGVQGIQIKAIVTINGVRQVCWFPVKDSKNNAVPINKVTETLIHNATQRAIVKCLAWHGFGLKLWIKDEEMLNKIQTEMEEANSVDKKAQWNQTPEDSTFEKDRKFFMGRLSDMGIKYEDLKNKLYKKGLPKPSSMPREKRTNLLKLLEENGIGVVDKLQNAKA